MTVVITGKLLDSIGELNVHTLIYDKESVEDAIIASVLKDKPVLGVYNNAWKRYEAVVHEIEKKGGNRFLYEPLDPIEFTYIGMENAKQLIYAKHSSLLMFRAQNATYKARPTKTVDRRALLTSPLKAIMDYYPAPIMAQPETCKAWKYCNNCIGSCPFNALEGKPPQVILDKCTGCGICTGSCPFGLLFMPQWNIESFSYLLTIIRRTVSKPLHLVAACRSTLKTVEPPPTEKKVHPALFIGVECPGWITDYHVVEAASHGFSITVLCDESQTEKCGGHRIFEERLTRTSQLGTTSKIISDPAQLMDVLSEPPKARILEENYSIIQDKTNTYKILQAYGVDSIEFSDPLVGLVEVDTDKCPVCEACSNLCPFRALELRDEEDKRKLVFLAGNCTVCGVCEEICPYNAIKLRYKYNSEVYNTPHVLAEDEIARCRKCGRPIGSMKHLKSLERKLRESGVDEWALEQLWLCNECKMKAVVERQLGKQGSP